MSGLGRKPIFLKALKKSPLTQLVPFPPVCPIAHLAGTHDHQGGYAAGARFTGQLGNATFYARVVGYFEISANDPTQG